MQSACEHVGVKPRTTNLTVRGLTRAERDELKRRAKRKGVTMSQYVIDLLEEALDLAEFEAGDLDRPMRRKPS